MKASRSSTVDPARDFLRHACYAAAIVLLASLGCGPEGLIRYRVSGTATYKGAPIPAGRVVFEPDPAKGNSGPQGFAVIQAGQFDTALPGSKGSIGGPMLVKIDGFDGVTRGEETPPLGMPLFPSPHVIQLDIPKADSVHAFEVPFAGQTKQN